MPVRKSSIKNYSAVSPTASAFRKIKRLSAFVLSGTASIPSQKALSSTLERYFRSRSPGDSDHDIPGAVSW